MFVGGQAFSVHRINGAQWGYSIILGALSMPVAVVIRCVPDELFARMIPRVPQRKKTGPAVVVEDDDDDRIAQWNPVLEEIKDELTFLKKIRGGRMSELAYKLQHPRQTFMPRSRSPSRSPAASNADLPQTPGGNEQTVIESVAATPQTPERGEKRRRARSSSTSVYGPATAMAGIIAGSIAGGWSPLERRSEEQETVRFTRSRSISGVDGTAGMEIHPDTKAEDPVFAENFQKTKIPPSQRADLAPHFEHAPPHSPDLSLRGRKSHSRQSSAQV